MMYTWEEVSVWREVLRVGVWRYFPLFTGEDGKFMLDLNGADNPPVLYYTDDPSDRIVRAYPTLDEFLLDVLWANESRTKLRFFKA